MVKDVFKKLQASIIRAASRFKNRLFDWLTDTGPVHPQFQRQQRRQSVMLQPITQGGEGTPPREYLEYLVRLKRKKEFDMRMKYGYGSEYDNELRAA